MNDFKDKNEYKDAEDAEFIEIDQNNTKSPRILRRSSTNKILFGVCGGLAEYYLVHPLIFRLIFIIGLLYTNYTIVVYGILAFLIKPPKIDEIKHQKFSIFMGYSILLFGAVLYIANKSAIFKYFIGTIDSTIYITFLLAFLGLYIFLEAGKFANKTATFNRNRLYKLNQKKLIGGVCIGLSKYLQISVTAIRIVFTITFVFTLGSFIFVYLVLLLTLPDYGEN